MSQQSGGDGYGKVRKACQTGGASGWAKHCGNTDDHKKSNRLERKLGKQEMDGEIPAPRMRTTRKRDKVPSRKHLMDKIADLDRRIKQSEKDMHDHKQRHIEDKPASVCYCSLWAGDRWSKWHREQRAKVVKEFEKHGYELPPPAPGPYKP